MIVATKSRLTPPYDPTQLYVLHLGVSRPPLYSPDSYFFASDDLQNLVPAVRQPERLVDALEAAITATEGFACSTDLQKFLDFFTFVPTPPPPRYPQAGDTNVHGIVRWFVTGGFWNRVWDPDTKTYYQAWMGQVDAVISANGYSTPPAGDSEQQFDFTFISRIPVCRGQAVLFDIVQGKCALGATNIRT